MSTTKNKRVWSCNEWDPLEEVIVGIADNATVPVWSRWLDAPTPDHAKWFFDKYGGQLFPEDMIEKANEELDNLSRVLEELGVTVQRPEPMDFTKVNSTPWWESNGLYATMPRDVMMVIGDTIIEAPMAWRERYFEIYCFRDLITEYFNDGARWLAAPKGSMADSFFNPDYDSSKAVVNGERTFVVAETEVAFDAADFVRFGKDIFVQKSNVTNEMGIEWVRRHLDSDFTLHEVSFGDDYPMHIDTTMVPLCPGKILMNPSWSKRSQLPSQFDSWDVIESPPPEKPYDKGLYFSSDWLSMNFLSVDEKRIIVEENEYTLMKTLEQHGFEPIPVPFRNFYPFGGSFHCATADIRRRGELESYFD